MIYPSIEAFANFIVKDARVRVEGTIKELSAEVKDKYGIELGDSWWPTVAEAMKALERVACQHKERGAKIPCQDCSVNALVGKMLWNLGYILMQDPVEATKFRDQLLARFSP